MLINGSLARSLTRWHVALVLTLAFGALLESTTNRADAQGSPSCPCSIWPSSAVPAVANDPETRAVEVGVRFRSDVDGFISAIRFYKGPLNTGTHTASLWTNTGTLLARTTFTNETVSGWQEVTLPTPVAITANTIYVASYHAPVGRYSINENYFATGVDNPPLHALANPNGRYRYNATSAFPNQTFRASNYWVDVVFTTTSSDSTPPTVTTMSPPNAATGVAAGANILATFSEDMTGASITTATFELRDQNNTLVPAAVSYNAATRVATLNPTANLPAGLSYTATVRSGPTGVKDASGNPMAADAVWFFKRGGTDSTPPSVTAVTPENGATGISTSTTVTATFAEAMNASTINTTTFTLTGPGGVVPAAVTYNAATRQAMLTPNAPLTAGTVHGARLVAGPSGVKDLANVALPADVTWSFTTGGADATPPTVVSVTPAAGAAGVNTGTTVTATFSEPMDPATINASTVELRDPGNTLVAGLVEYNPTTRAATMTPTSALAAGTTYTATVRGGASDPRVKDVAGNALASSFSWSFTTSGSQPPSGCPCTIWSATTTPAIASFNDNTAVELGVKFRSDLDGFITGVRFYKGAANTGTHVGKVWSIAGELLGSVTFNNESPSGWQQANFATPIAIAADTTYVASYHTTVGFYAINSGYFGSAGTDQPPLHAPSTVTADGNGVFQYGPGGFPAQTFNATNYWVDVVFNTTANIPTDTTAPRVVAIRPSNGVGGVGPNINVTVTFSEAMDAATIDIASIELRGPGNNLVPSSVSYDPPSRTATVNPSGSLLASAAYTLTVRGGATDPRVKDVAGNALAANVTSSFSTATNATAPALGQGPGGPILVVTTPQNKFSTYYSEILYAEGLNLFSVDDASAINSSRLSGFDLVILGEMPLTAAQVTTLTDWVNAGGNLVAMRPDKALSPLLGLADTDTTLSDAYLLVNTSEPPGEGIVAQTMQFHGVADRYTLAGATAVATLYSSPTAATSNPAVTLRSLGGGGGHAAAFTYDLAKSVVHMRQGNPSWAGEERDGTSPVRPDDQFYGAAASDPQPDWIDLDRVAIPQADEQQRLLANLMVMMNANRKPLPRFWYLPRGLKAVVVMTGDDHANGGTTGRFEQYLAASPPGCDVDNWECVRGTSYIYISSTTTDAQAARYHGLGFEIGLHVLTGCADYTPSSLATFYADQLAEFRATYPSIPAPTTNRTHCIAWSDWSTQAQVESTHSIGFDTNYYYWPPGWLLDRPGFFTGSSMPMRFTEPDGTLIDVYQATTQMTDESGQSYPATVNTLLDRALGPLGYYGIFTANMHTDLVDSPGSDAIVASAQARGVPIVTARQMLEWLDGRNGSSFDAVTWNGVSLGFTVEVGIGANGLQVMVPAQFSGRALTGISLNSAPVSFTLRMIKGVQWATFAGVPGIYEATYAAP
jgi:Domain of unknown function (DUF4082)/Bacterial Ig-like domain